jgi:hypothetical protein
LPDKVTVGLSATVSFNVLVVNLNACDPMMDVNTTFATGTSSQIRTSEVEVSGGGLLLMMVGVLDYTSFNTILGQVSTEFNSSNGGAESSTIVYNSQGQGGMGGLGSQSPSTASGGSHGWIAVLISFQTANSQLSLKETQDCLQQKGVNTTYRASATESLVVTNLTASSTPSCQGQPEHWGLYVLSNLNSQPSNAIFVGINNTTGIVLRNLTYIFNFEPLFNESNLLDCGTQQAFWNSTLASYYTLVGAQGNSCYFEGKTIGGGGSTTSGSGGCPTGGTSPMIYVWDSVCFEKGGSTAYPHPDLSYYGIVQSANWFKQGTQLWHIQLGTNTVALLNNIGPIGVGAILGAALGAYFGGPYGAAAGAAIGMILGALGAYFANAQFESETGSWWAWLNTGFLTAMENVPWYVYALGPTTVALWLIQYLTELRVGNTWFVNQAGISGP